MYRAVILIYLVVGVLAQEDKIQCGHARHPSAVACCSQSENTVNKYMNSDDLSECLQLPNDPIKCDRALCVAKKKGFATNDQKIDKAKLSEVLNKVFGSEPDLLVDIKSKCVNGDLNVYAPDDYCDFVKMTDCVTIQVLKHCPKWNDSVDCTKMKGMVEECVKLTS